MENASQIVKELTAKIEAHKKMMCEDKKARTFEDGKILGELEGKRLSYQLLSVSLKAYENSPEKPYVSFPVSTAFAKMQGRLPFLHGKKGTTVYDEDMIGIYAKELSDTAAPFAKGLIPTYWTTATVTLDKIVSHYTETVQ